MSKIHRFVWLELAIVSFIAILGCEWIAQYALSIIYNPLLFLGMVFISINLFFLGVVLVRKALI